MGRKNGVNTNFTNNKFLEEERYVDVESGSCSVVWSLSCVVLIDWGPCWKIETCMKLTVLTCKVSGKEQPGSNAYNHWSLRTNFYSNRHRDIFVLSIVMFSPYKSICIYISLVSRLCFFPVFFFFFFFVLVPSIYYLQFAASPLCTQL